MKEVKVSFPTLTICMHFGMEKQRGISCSQMILYTNILLYFHACCVKMSLPLKRHLRYIHVYFICEIRSGSTRLILQHCNAVRARRQLFRIRIICADPGLNLDPGRPKLSQKKEKMKKISCLKSSLLIWRVSGVAPSVQSHFAFWVHYRVI